MTGGLAIPMTDAGLPLTCPCGFDYVGMSSVVVDQNGAVVKVNRAGVEQGQQFTSGAAAV